MKYGFIKNIILNNLSQGLQFGSRWAFSISLLYVLGIEQFAVFSFMYSISNILISFLPFGSQVYLINKVNDIETGQKELVKTLELLLLLFFIVLFGVLIYLFIIDGTNGGLIFLSVFLSFILSINTVLFSFFKGLGDFSFELKIYIVFSILLFLLIGYLFFISVLSLPVLFVVLILINMAVTLLSVKYTSIISIKKISGHFTFSFYAIKETIKERFFFGIQDIVTASFAQGGMLVLYYIISKEVYGEYRGLLLLAAPFALINVAFSQVLLNQIKNVSSQRIREVFRKIQLPFLAGLIIILLLMFWQGAFIVRIISKLTYRTDIKTAFIGVLIIILTSFVYAGYEMILVVLNKQKLRFYVMLIGAIMNICSILILLPDYGIKGAIYTNVLSNLAVFIPIVIISEIQLKKVE